MGEGSEDFGHFYVELYRASRHRLIGGSLRMKPVEVKQSLLRNGLEILATKLSSGMYHSSQWESKLAIDNLEKMKFSVKPDCL